MGQGCGGRSLGVTQGLELRAATDPGRPGGSAAWDLGESCWPSPSRVRPAAGESHLGRALSRSFDPFKPREAPPAWLLGEPRDCAGGPRIQAAASDPGKKPETLEDLFASCGPEDLRGARERAPAPWRVERIRGGRGRWRTAADRRLRPGQLARWAKGLGAALGPGRRRWEKQPGWVARPRMPL